MRFLVALAVTVSLGACRDRAASIVVVRLSSVSLIAPISTVVAHVSAMGRMVDHRFTLGAQQSVPPTITFGVEFAREITGQAEIVAEARDATDTLLAAGLAAVPIVVGGRADCEIVLQGAAADSDAGVPPGAVPPGPGSLVSVGPRASGSLRLIDDGFEYGNASCSGTLCVVGGLRP